MTVVCLEGNGRQVAVERLSPVLRLTHVTDSGLTYHRWEPDRQHLAEAFFLSLLDLAGN